LWGRKTLSAKAYFKIIHPKRINPKKILD